MAKRPHGSAGPTDRRSRAGRTLVAFWVFGLLVVAAMAAWLQVLGPPPAAGTAPVAAVAPQAPAVTPPEISTAQASSRQVSIPAETGKPTGR